MIKRILIFIMIFTIVINFISYDNAYAATLSLGSIYGTELGSEMLAFLLASLAVGVTYSSLEQVEQLLIEYEPINWDEMLGSAPYPPPGGGNNPNKKLITALLLGVPGGAFLSSIFGDLISWFKGLGVEEGENQILIEGDTVEYVGDIVFTLARVGYNRVYTEDGKSIWVIVEYVNYYPNDELYKFSVRFEKPDGTFNTITHWDESQNPRVWVGSKKHNVLQVYIFGNKIGDDINNVVVHPFDSSELEDGQPKESINLEFNVSPDSSVITEIPPTKIPQPDITKLPGIETITTPSGHEEIIYPGDFEDLVDEIVNNITFDDVKNIISGSNPYIITETQQGLKIDRGQESPFPDVNTDPIEDTDTYQGTTVGLLQSIINWLSLIRNEISSLPNKLFEVPQDLSLNFDNLKLNGFQERFPFSIPWDIASAIGVFSSSPTEPDLTIDMDTNYFSLNHEIDISSISLPLRFARYVASVFFVIYLANKTRDLIKW